jgi:hypothetical protein
MKSKTKIAIATPKGDLLKNVDVLYTKGNAAVHKSFESDDLFTVSNIHCGFAYAKFFETKAGAIFFADYVAGVPELNEIRSPSDAAKLKTDSPHVVIALRNKFEEIRD